MSDSPAFVPAPFFVLRTPLLPFEDLVRLSEGLSRGGEDGGAKGLATDRRLVRERLRTLADWPEVREALFVASPSLDESLRAWRADPEGERGRKAELTLFRYVARMTGRATPFGLFSACATGTVGARTMLAASERPRRHSRLDTDFLLGLCDALGRDPAIRRHATYRVNSSLYEAAGRVRFVVSYDEGGARRYRLVAADPSPHLAAAIGHASRGETGARLTDLAKAVRAIDEDVSLDEAEAFVEDLIEAQILVSDLAPSVTGPEPTAEIIEALRAHDGTRDLAARLDAVAEGLRAFDAEGLGVAPDRYRAVAAHLESAPVRVDLPRLFQVDLFRDAAGSTLGGEPLREILRGAELLCRITPSRDSLADFTRAFAERYGGEEVPLLTAIDEEAGIGFLPQEGPGASAEPLLAGLPFRGAEATTEWHSRDAYLLRRLQTATRRGERSIELDAADLTALEVARRPPPPDAAAITATLVAASQEALDRGDFQVVLGGLAGPSGANLLGRFCHGDRELRARVEEHLRAEERCNPDVVFAEVVHLPEGRVGNVILRPVLRGYEIPYLGRSGAPSEAQIDPSDLVLPLIDDQIRLRSRRLDREVVPRITSAHNFAMERNLPVYRFLGMLARRRRAEGAAFHWGPLGSAGFLPRVTHGRLVLSRARWSMRPADLRAVTEAQGEARMRAMREVRREHGLPAWIAVVEGDRELPLDLENVVAVDALVQIAKEAPSVTFVELAAGPESLCCRGAGGGFVHELVLPLVRADVRGPVDVRTEERRIPAQRDRASSVFAPGSEWLYAKLYAGAATADAVLLDLLRPVARRALASGAADRWFFLRYADPGWHLRLRIHGAPSRVWGEVLADLLEAARPLLADGRIARLDLATYQRETDRYGGPAGIVLAEQVFQADSEAAASLVEAFRGDGEARWRIALLGADAMLDDLGLQLPQKRDVIERLYRGFSARFDPDVHLTRAFGDRFRTQRASLEALFDAAALRREPMAPGARALQRRGEITRPLLRALRGREGRGELSRSVAHIAESFVHMFVNRVLRSEAVAQEVVIYDFLARLYDSQQARARGKKRAPVPVRAAGASS